MKIQSTERGMAAAESKKLHGLRNGTKIEIEWFSGEKAYGEIVSTVEYSRYGSYKVNKIRITQAEMDGVYASGIGRKPGSIGFRTLTTL